MWQSNFPIKLELGSGGNPQPGYVHLDIRPDSPHVEIFHDLQEPLPLPDCSVEKILANHCLEHITWRKIRRLVQECYRVLLPGGKIFIRTPDLEFIVQGYLNNRTTPEHPLDEAFIREQFGEVTASWWAILKLFSGQDYPANFHYACYDFKTLKEIFQQCGFIKIERIREQPVYFPGEIQLRAFKPAAGKELIGVAIVPG